MKPVTEWDETYILNLPLGEFDWLEVKGRRALDLTISNVRENHVRDNLSKAISAFANSGGGQLIFGLKDPKSETECWRVDDGGIAVTNGHGDTREWLENIIPNLVNYPLTGFNVYAILPQTPDSQIQPGRALFVIDIPDSPDAPHQAQCDQRYYIRIAGHSKPINHRQVSDIMNRRRYPKIELDFFVQTTEATVIKVCDLHIQARNMGRLYAQYVNCKVYLPPSLGAHYPALFGRNVTEIEGQRYVLLERSNIEKGTVQPILPGLEYDWRWELPHRFRLPPKDNSEVILWEVYADNAPVERGSFPVRGLTLRRRREKLLKVFWFVLNEETRVMVGSVLAVIFIIVAKIIIGKRTPK